MRHRRWAAIFRLPHLLAVLLLFSIVGGVLGQSMLTPSPGFQGAPSIPQLGVPSSTAAQMNAQIDNEINGEANAATASQPTTRESDVEEAAAGAIVAPVQNLMEWGALHLHAELSHQFLYDSEIHTRPGESTATTTYTISAPIAAQIGPHVTLNYTPSYRIFSERGFRNTLDHYASLSAGVGYGDWSFGLSQAFSRTDEPLIETSSQTSQDNYNTGLSAVYHATDKISLEVSCSVDLTFVSGSESNVFIGGGTNTPGILTDSQDYSGSQWINYQMNEKLAVGVGFTFGYTEQQNGLQSADEQYQGRFTWRPGKKVTVAIVGGVEDRQFLNSDAPDNLTPIFTTTASYEITGHTSLSLQASRSVNASLFEQQITESTQLGIGLQQRLLGLMQLSMGFSYSSSDFKTARNQLAVVRTDDTESCVIGLSLPFFKRGNVGAFYSYNVNSSSQPGFGYSSSEVGATLSWAY